MLLGVLVALASGALAANEHFAWDDVCTRIISMPHSQAQRDSVIKQLAGQGITRVDVSAGLVLNTSTAEEAMRRAVRSCIVPTDYSFKESPISPRWMGTIGSSLAHLGLWHTARRIPPRRCSWLMVLADDVVLLPGFSGWVAEKVMAGEVARDADFINLAVVRSWGAETRGGRSIAKRVTGELSWPPWSQGRSAAHAAVRNPNLLVSGYLVRLATLPRLLDSFAQTAQWRPQCSIDQVLSRVQYALASSGQYTSYNVDATASQLAHCAVGASERDLFQRWFPERHASCLRYQPDVYGGGSRSHERRLRKSRRLDDGQEGGALPTPHGSDRQLELVTSDVAHDRPELERKRRESRPTSPGCFHGFRVPGDRVSVDEKGYLVTVAGQQVRRQNDFIGRSGAERSSCSYSD